MESEPVVVTDPEDLLPHDEVLHPVLSPTGCNPDRPRDQHGGPCGLARRRCVDGDNARIAQGVLSSSYPLLLEGGVVPDGRARLTAVPHLSERFCGTVGFHLFLQRTALTEEKRRPFLGPKTPCFLTPLLPKHKLLRARLVLRWGDDQRILGVVCSFLEN